MDGGVVGVEEIDGEGEEEESGGADEEFAAEKMASCWSGVVKREEDDVLGGAVGRERGVGNVVVLC